MNWASSEAVAILAFLLPGFVAAAIFYSLTSFPRPDAFERVVLALIFTAISQAITEYGLSVFVEAGGAAEAGSQWRLLSSIPVAAVLGLGAAVSSNTDAVHGLCRCLRITRETSYPSEWYSTFARLNDNSYIVLHLPGERRLYGHAREWPSNPKDGHFCVIEPEWLGENNERSKTGVSAMLIPASEVTMVEFLSVDLSGE